MSDIWYLMCFMSDIWYGNLCVYEWYLIPVSVWEISDTFVCMSETQFLCVYELSLWLISDICVFISDIWFLCLYDWYLCLFEWYLISVSLCVISDICVFFRWGLGGDYWSWRFTVSAEQTSRKTPRIHWVQLTGRPYVLQQTPHRQHPRGEVWRGSVSQTLLTSLAYLMPLKPRLYLPP